MSRTLSLLDRVVVLLVGLALVALGLLLVDWHLELAFSYPDSLDTSSVSSVVEAGWWPWVFAVAGLLLGLLALVWILAHLRPSGPSTKRLLASGPSGTVEADVRSVASAAAARLEELAPVTGASGSTRAVGRTTLVELRGHVDPAADATALVEAVETCASEVATAFPDDAVTCRVVLDAPQRTRSRRNTRVRVQ